jgi:hypothetical protein
MALTLALGFGGFIRDHHGGFPRSHPKVKVKTGIAEKHQAKDSPALPAESHG